MSTPDGALIERRDSVRRAEFVKSVLRSLVHTATAEFTVEDVQQRLNTSTDTAQRILSRLVSAGVFRQVRRDLWVKVLGVQAADKVAPDVPSPR